MTRVDALLPLLHPSSDVGWFARLELGVEARPPQARARVQRHAQEGPLYLQRALYPEGPELPHLYVLHPPGGLVGGDRLELGVTIEANAAALVTTPAAQKLYRSAGPRAHSRVRLRAAPGAALEWLPSETIVFDGARAVLETDVVLAADAAYCGWDIVCFGRPAAGETFAHGALSTSLRIRREARGDAGTLLLINERAEMSGGCAALSEPWGFAGQPVFGNLYCVPRDPALAPALVPELREALGAGDDYAATALDGVLVVRCVAPTCEKARARLIATWHFIRPRALGRAAIPPRIWRT